ncbi:hypothetical protein NM688_g4060 [Phlebia brevispora]|uniref:Uncharacterized protein n=1 Tax=Phlebia brevispora TaxID=194682 RepID=A0ACC1T406_9APHY|nr:hypothetical protein NM688_g4060 [Phlebia brevispora]
MHRTLTRGIVLSLAVRFCLPQQLTIGCFESGLDVSCAGFIISFCSSVEDVSVPPLRSVSQCVPFPGGTHCDFSAWQGAANSTDPAVPLNVGNCEGLLNVVSILCDNGGSAIFNGDTFVYSMQANDGLSRQLAAFVLGTMSLYGFDFYDFDEHKPSLSHIPMIDHHPDGASDTSGLTPVDCESGAMIASLRTLLICLLVFFLALGPCITQIQTITLDCFGGPGEAIFCDTSAFTEFCSEASQTSVPALQSISRCFPAIGEGDPVRCDFNAWQGAVNSSAPAAFPDMETCLDLLTAILNACDVMENSILLSLHSEELCSSNFATIVYADHCRTTRAHEPARYSASYVRVEWRFASTVVLSLAASPWFAQEVSRNKEIRDANQCIPFVYSVGALFHPLRRHIVNDEGYIINTNPVNVFAGLFSRSRPAVQHKILASIRPLQTMNKRSHVPNLLTCTLHFYPAHSAGCYAVREEDAFLGVTDMRKAGKCPAGTTCSAYTDSLSGASSRSRNKSCNVASLIEALLLHTEVLIRCFTEADPNGADCTDVESICSNFLGISIPPLQSLSGCLPTQDSSLETARCDFRVWNGLVNASGPPAQVDLGNCFNILGSMGDPEGLCAGFGGSAIISSDTIVYSVQSNLGDCGSVTALPDPA